MSMTFSPATVVCVMRLIGQSKVQSKMMLVGLHDKRGLSSVDHMRNAFDVSSPFAVYCGRDGAGLRARICSSVIFPAAKSSRRLRGTSEPLPPLGGIVSTACSTAQSPEMFGSPDGKRSGRFDVSTGALVN